MKKSIKGIVLASLISTQVLAAPISAFAVTAETTENSEQVGPLNTEEPVGEVVAPDATEVNQDESAKVETPELDETEAVDTMVEGELETPAIDTPTEVIPEVESEPAEDIEAPVEVASEEKMQAVRTAVADAQAILDAGTYMAETSIPLKTAMAAATVLLSQPDVTDGQLDATIADINEKVAGLVKAEVELSFVRNLVVAISDATHIIKNTGDFEGLYTTASVKAKKTGIQAAVDAGKAVLAGVVAADGKIVTELAVNNREGITEAAEAIITAMNEGGGLVRKDQLVDILLEASKLKDAKVASDEDKADFEMALKQVVDAIENALTDAEADAAVSALRAAMDNLRLIVVVSAVDESGNLIMDQTATSINGLYKTAWSVEPPVVEGYECVSSNNQPVTFTRTAGQVTSGTFGDGTNDVTFVYKKSVDSFVPPFIPEPKEPFENNKQPDIISVKNEVVKTNKTYHSKTNLPKTGEQTSSIASFGLFAIAASTVAFFKKRKINE